jgi:hypothetical protein
LGLYEIIKENMSLLKNIAKIFFNIEETDNTENVINPNKLSTNIIRQDDASPFMQEVYKEIEEVQKKFDKPDENKEEKKEEKKNVSTKKQKSQPHIKEAIVKYVGHDEAVIISCFFNPTKSKYRLDAFNKFYDSIKHLNHRIVECVIGNDFPQLQENEYIARVYSKNLLWHKETLLNKIISELPKKFKYVFWVDADVSFTNLNWMVDGVKELQKNNIVQLFEYCTHLDRDETEPSNKNLFKKQLQEASFGIPNKKVWRSFCANFVDNKKRSESVDYDIHGHVGFAWGAKREILDACPLYDRALVGGADHIIAHAAAGQIVHECIKKSFTSDLTTVRMWSNKFYNLVRGKIGYVKGNLYHTWHGDTEKRRYLKRIQDLTPRFKSVTKKDENGLYETNDQYIHNYMLNYFLIREVVDDDKNISYVGTGTDPVVKEFDGFGGGSFGGGGASGSWDTDSKQPPSEFGGTDVDKFYSNADSVDHKFSDYSDNSNNQNFS